MKLIELVLNKNRSHARHILQGVSCECGAKKRVTKKRVTKK